MKNETKKIIAKEILIFTTVFIVSIFFIVGIHLNNIYQSNHIRILQKDYNSKSILLDSINKPIKQFTDKSEEFRKNVFRQLAKLDNNFGESIKLPKGYKLNEKIGESILINENKMVRFIDLIAFDNIISNFDSPNELPIFINIDKFNELIIDSISFRMKIYKKLKLFYDDSNCSKFELFEEKIGAKPSFEILKLKKDANEIIENCKKINKKILNSKNNIIEENSRNIYTIRFFYIFLIISFPLRYFYNLIKWSIVTLKKE
jgi:hypothetical protein